MRKTLLCLFLAVALHAAADPLNFHLSSMVSGITFSNQPGAQKLSIGFGDCGLFPGHVFQLCTTGNGSSLVFGDGVYGVTPGPQDQIQANYSTGNGSEGNFSSDDSLGIFLKFSQVEIDGAISHFLFTPLCHPQCDLVTMETFVKGDGLNQQIQINALIQLPTGADLVSLMNSTSQQSITGNLVPEPQSIMMILLSLPFALRRCRLR